MDNLSELSTMIKKQCELHGKLLALENTKSDVLIKGDIDALSELMKEEQPIMMECANLERNRQQLQEMMGMGEATLREIALKCDKGDQYSLSGMLKELSDIVDKLKKVNNLNMEILGSRMQTIQYMNSIVFGMQDQVTYQKR